MKQSGIRQTQRQNFSRSLLWILLAVGTVFVSVSLCMVKLLEDPHDETMETWMNVVGNGSTEKNQSIEKWDYPFVHIINTRFMQHQGHLVDLARARLVLFETFCLESMIHQTVWDFAREPGQPPPFLWIIKTDPKLDESVRNELIALLKPHPNFYLVGSNVNFGIGIHSGGWRGGEAGRDVLVDSSNMIYTGNVTWLQRAHAFREKRAVLETRLDADDGLHVLYLEAVQLEAHNKLRSSLVQPANETMKWMYWCAKNHMDWTPSAPFVTANNSNNVSEFGIFVARRIPNACITAGITLGVSVGQAESSIPRYMHQKLFIELELMGNNPDCGGDKCIRMISDPFLGALRSRTPTSAGMKGVAQDETNVGELSEKAIPTNNSELRKVLRHCFRVDVPRVIATNRYVHDHFVDMVADNLRGQCTQGHSCKNTTKEALQTMLEAARNETSFGVDG